MHPRSVSFILTSCVIAFLSLSGCLDITTTSQVYSDGSIERSITMTGDSAAVYGGRYPLDLDSTWTRTYAPVAGKPGKYTMTAKRLFNDVEEMNRVLGGTFSKTLQYRFELEKSFQWFFTVYRYKEINLPTEQFTSRPMTEFLSTEEIAWATERLLDKEEAGRAPLTRGDSLAMEAMTPRFEEYTSRNRFEPIFEAFLGGIRTINDPSLSVEKVLPLKDSLYNRSRDQLNKGNIDTLRIIFARVLRTPLVEKAWRAGTRDLEEFERKLSFEQDANSHSYVTNVVMPGLITGSNATTIQGATATWKEFKDRAHYFGFTMWVESRQVNWWAVGIAAVAVLVLLALLIASLLRRKIHQ
jgi:hypothetical protein